jgi:hypothetical protein
MSLVMKGLINGDSGSGEYGAFGIYFPLVGRAILLGHSDFDNQTHLLYANLHQEAQTELDSVAEYGHTGGPFVYKMQCYLSTVQLPVTNRHVTTLTTSIWLDGTIKHEEIATKTTLLQYGNIAQICIITWNAGAFIRPWWFKFAVQPSQSMIGPNSWETA